MGKSFDIKVEMTGAVEFGRGVSEFRKGLTGLSEAVSYKAAQMTADEARPTVPVGKTARAARSVQAYMTGSYALAKGGEGLSYYSWLEYGGDSGRHHSNHRARVAEGRYIYPAYERIKPQIQTMLERETEKYVNQIFG